jgi:hypothetical protein
LKPDLENLPPVVQILLSERPRGRESPKGFLKRLLPELRRQAEWTMLQSSGIYVGRDAALPRLVIDPSAGLDPFSGYGKCADPACRLQNADLIARTVGLYADCAVIGDPFTDHVLIAEQWSDYDTFKLIGNLLVFRRLQPMFNSGVFRFATNFGGFCQNHSDMFKEQVTQIANEVLAEVKTGLSLVRKKDHLEIHTSELLGLPMVHSAKLTAAVKRKLARSTDPAELAAELYGPYLHAEVHETLFKMRRAEPWRAVTFSNSRVSLLAARHFDRAMPSQAELEIWEASRSAYLPWVRDLSPTEIVQLRMKADRALPRFRERIGRALTSDDGGEVKAVVRELRDEASEVEAELAALDAQGESRFRTASGVLGMTISVYGFAGEFLAAGAALTGLATLFGLLHAAHRKEQHEVGKLTSRPGYVLVKARELAEHAPKQ